MTDVLIYCTYDESDAEILWPGGTCSRCGGDVFSTQQGESEQGTAWYGGSDA